MTSRYILSYLASGIGIGYFIHTDKVYFMKNVLHLMENNSQERKIILNDKKTYTIKEYLSYRNISSITGIFLLYFLYLKSYSFNDVMYVTKTTFFNSINVLAGHIKNVQKYISRVNTELQKKLGNVENSLEETKELIEKQSHDVKQVLDSQLNTETSIISLESKIGIANKGIKLLCTSVSKHIEKSYELDAYIRETIPIAELVENRVSEKMQALDIWTKNNNMNKYYQK